MGKRRKAKKGLFFENKRLKHRKIIIIETKGGLVNYRLK